MWCVLMPTEMLFLSALYGRLSIIKKKESPHNELVGVRSGMLNQEMKLNARTKGSYLKEWESKKAKQKVEFCKRHVGPRKVSYFVAMSDPYVKKKTFFCNKLLF